MLIQFDENDTGLDDTVVELPQLIAPHSAQERCTVTAGQGKCKSCDDCRGYRPDKPNYCKCGHHFSQHQ